MVLQFEKSDISPKEFPDDSHPMILYLSGDPEMREEILLNHPEVLGFVYLHEDSITKAFLLKKVVNFKENAPEKRKVIVAVSGDSEENTPFSIPIKDLLSDSLHLTDCNSLSKLVPSISVGKYIKENARALPELPREFDTDGKIKKLKIVAFPMVLPIVKGFTFFKGDIDDDEVYDKFGSVHALYADWAFLFIKKYIVSSDFNTPNAHCPMPERLQNSLTTLKEIPIKVLFKSKQASGPYQVIKEQIELFISANKKPESIEISVPKIVDMADDKTLASSAASSTSVTNERLTAFMAILFSSPTFDRNGDISHLVPAQLSDEISEILTSASSSSEQARLFADGIEVLAEDISKERSYLSRAAKFPFLSSTVLKYCLQAHYHSGAIDSNMDSLKKSFNILALLSPPLESVDEYRSYINSSKNIEVDDLLEQQSEKRASIKKDIFIKGKQETMEDVLAFIANIIVFVRFWVKMDLNKGDQQPLLVQLFMELSDFLSSSEFVQFNEKFKATKIYMPHTLITYIFNIFSIFIKMAKNPHVVCKFKIENTIDAKEVKIAKMMHENLMDQLNLCTVTSSTQNLFAECTSSTKIMFITIH